MNINKIVIHCADTPATMNVNATTIRKWHTDPPPKGNGWRDIGYHYVICRDGTIQKGRDDETPGAHVRGHNHDSLGVCMVGGRPDSNFTAAQWQSLDGLVKTLTTQHPDAEILGHRDLDSNKTCPLFDVKAWASTLRTDQ